MKNPQKIVVFTGAGMSAPSGLATFRDPDGIWSRYRVEEVATSEAWAANPAKVLEFYNLRRTQLAKAEPNAGHLAIAALEEKYQVTVITQNVDNLHERSGSSKVIHLHGELTKVRSDKDPSRIYDIGCREVHLGDFCERGGQLRPHVVWFGEQVLYAEEAVHHIQECNILIVAGTSLQVFPAAGMILHARERAEKYLVDITSPKIPSGFTFLRGSVDEMMPGLAQDLLG